MPTWGAGVPGGPGRVPVAARRSLPASGRRARGPTRLRARGVLFFHPRSRSPARPLGTAAVPRRYREHRNTGQSRFLCPSEQ